MKNFNLELFCLAMPSFTRNMTGMTKVINICVSTQNMLKIQIRQACYVSRKLVYEEYGEPTKVIKQCEEELSGILKPKEILVKMLAAPVNPSDINTLEGKYPSRPKLPAVPGNEGVGEVLEVGNQVKNICIGNRVVVIAPNLGTWRSHAVFPKNKVLVVPKKLGLVEAATLTVNPCTAYRMLRDFTDLKPGDTIIQNGANSACGQNVIQICRVWGIQTINIVRDRPNIEELKKILCQLGATLVLTEQELNNPNCLKDAGLPKPTLALNCVGGKNAMQIMRQLQPGCTIVTYGGMSKQPVTVPTPVLIFKDIIVRGFWSTRWSKENFKSEERKDMFDELISMMTNDELQGPASKMIDFDNYKEALSNALGVEGMVGQKYILKFKH